MKKIRGEQARNIMGSIRSGIIASNERMRIDRWNRSINELSEIVKEEVTLRNNKNIKYLVNRRLDNI